MIVQVYAGDVLIYDNRLENYALFSLKVQAKAESGGNAALQMPRTHPAYSRFVSLKTIVKILRDGELIFRGRALFPSDDFDGSRTITCESERCFFADAVMRPYLYRTDPAAIFRDIVAIYNEQVDVEKRFAVGSVTVTDANDYVRMESESATTVAEALRKLVNRCGGYITFSTNADGKRAVNWLAELSHYSTQNIEFGENLLDFSRTDDAADLATVLIPYGAKDEETGERVTIESVNDGKDYIEAADAIALRGRIVKAVTWDSVTLPGNLLNKATAYLAEAKLITTQLSLSAVDLSAMDKDIDTFSVGDLVHVKSKMHGIDADYLLLERSYDLLNPASDTVTLGKSYTTLTGSAESGERRQTDGLDRVERDARADYEKNKAMISETETWLTSLIEQTSESIRSEVSAQQKETDALKGRVTEVEQTAGSVSVRVGRIEADGVNKVTTSTGFTFDENGLTVEKSGAGTKTTVDETGLTVQDANGASAEELLYAGVDSETKESVVKAKNIRVSKYLIVGKNSRFEDYEADGEPRTGCFFIG